MLRAWQACATARLARRLAKWAARRRNPLNAGEASIWHTHASSNYKRLWRHRNAASRRGNSNEKLIRYLPRRSAIGNRAPVARLEKAETSIELRNVFINTGAAAERHGRSLAGGVFIGSRRGDAWQLR